MHKPLSRTRERLLALAFVFAALWIGYLLPDANTMAASQEAVGPLALQQARATGGGGWTMSMPDAIATHAPIATATTTLVVQGSTSQAIFVFWAGVVASGVNTTSTFNYEYGTGATCGTGTVLFVPAIGAPPNPPTAGLWQTLYAGVPLNGAVASIDSADMAMAIPQGNSLCIVTAGTTIAVEPMVYYAQH
jgi:hypothetical protein